MKKLGFCIAFLLMLSLGPAQAEEPKKDPLYDEILAMDTRLFTAFNEQDLETFKEIFDPSLEFFHDTGGLADYAQSIENSRRLFDADTGLTRELLADTVEVHPIAGYGAIQVGKHRFCHPENGVMDCGTFDFLHIWKKTGDKWTVTRVVSYGH